MERRRYPRYNIQFPVECIFERDNVNDSALTVNISEQGALLLTEKFFGIDSILKLTIFLIDTNFDIQGKVLHTHYERKIGPYNIGLKFLDPPYNFIEKFYREVEALEVFRKELIREKQRNISLTEASLEWYGPRL